MGRYRKDVGEVIKYAQERGFNCEGMTGSGHWRLRHRNGRVLILPATPKPNTRWHLNAKADINRIHNLKDKR